MFLNDFNICIDKWSKQWVQFYYYIIYLLSISPIQLALRVCFRHVFISTYSVHIMLLFAFQLHELIYIGISCIIVKCKMKRRKKVIFKYWSSTHLWSTRDLHKHALNTLLLFRYVVFLCELELGSGVSLKFLTSGFLYSNNC